MGTTAEMEQDQAPAGGLRSHSPTHDLPGLMITPSGTLNSENLDLRSVQKRLEENFKESRTWEWDTDHEFLPRKALTKILTEGTIQSLLQQKPETSHISLADITGDKRRVKIFAILLLIKKTEHIGHIIKQGVSDDDLPLRRSRLKTCLRAEDRHVKEFFLSYQYEVAVPAWDFSAHEIQEEQYDRDQRLPFLTKLPISSGGQGMVWKIEIHRDHYETKTQSNRWERLHRGPEFALKEFGIESHFRDELEALKLFNQHDTKHEHLIKALAAYSQFGRHFLIFPLAEGNLDAVWQEAGPSLRDPLWLLTQCHGLTQGLQRIHQYKTPKSSPQQKGLLGRHGDIKPGNILWFKDPSTSKDRLVLSDFTLMRFHAEGSNRETTMARIGGTGTYRAPEVTVMSGKHVSQKYDVWSLGCVFLEFISCHLVGYSATRGYHFQGDDGRDCQSFGVLRFMEDPIEWGYPEDKYFLYKPGLQEAEVKKSVRKWLLYLHGQKSCSDALHDFLDVIEEHMLVHRPEIRWPIQKVLGRLATILSQSRRQDEATDYCNVGRPREASVDQFPPLWNEDEYCQRRRPYPESQTSTQSQITSNAFANRCAKPRDREFPADAIGSKHDLGQIEHIFADQILPLGPPRPEHTRTTNAATSQLAPRDGDIPYYGSKTCENYHKRSSEAITDTSRQMMSLQRGYACMPDQLPSSLPAFAYKNSRYTDLLKVNGNIRVSHRSPEPDLLSTPTTSYCPASSDAYSTYTEEPRPSTSSRTDESVSETGGCSKQSNELQVSHPDPGIEISQPEVPARSPPRGDTIPNGPKGTDISPTAETIETRSSRKHGLASIWKKMRLLQGRAFRTILRGRRRVGREGR